MFCSTAIYFIPFRHTKVLNTLGRRATTSNRCIRNPASKFLGYLWARSWATPRASSGRSKSYLASRFPYTANDTSNQQLSRIVLGGNIHKNPGPTEKRTPKYPCKESGKGVRLNQDALLCTECNVWSHAKCMNLSKAGFKYYLDYPDIERTCSLCSLPFRFEQSLVGVENLTQYGGEGEYAIANEDVAGYANCLNRG